MSDKSRFRSGGVQSDIDALKNKTQYLTGMSTSANEIWLSFTATTGEVLRLGFVAGNQNFKIRMMDKNWQELWHIN